MTRRLLVSFLSITLIVLGALEIPLALSYEHRELQDLTSHVERDAFVLASFVEDELEQRKVTTALSDAAAKYAQRTQSRVVIVDAAGLALVDTDGPGADPRTFASRPEFKRALSGEVAAGRRRSDTLDTDLVFVAVPVASGGRVHGAVRLTLPLSDLTSRVHRYWATLGLIAFVSVVSVMLAGFAFARWVAGPLRHLQASAAAFGTGDLGTRASTRAGPPEVRALAGTFNQMAARLEDLVQAQDAFVADASHQLRTPLTALRLQLENLRAGVDSDVEGALDEVGRLWRLVNGLLALARADRGEGGADDVDLHDLLMERRAVWQALAAERDVDIVVEGSPRVMARGDRDRISQVVDNLVANALDASPAGSSIVLAAGRSDGQAEFHVRDHGPGMTPDERAHAFDRFWRAEHAGAGDGSLGGSGLGLSIVAKLVKADGGAVFLGEADGGGLDAVVRLPALTTS